MDCTKLDRAETIQAATNWIVGVLRERGNDVDYPSQETAAILMALDFADEMVKDNPSFGYGIAAGLVINIASAFVDFELPKDLYARLTGKDAGV